MKNYILSNMDIMEELPAKEEFRFSDLAEEKPYLRKHINALKDSDILQIAERDKRTHTWRMNPKAAELVEEYRLRKAWPFTLPCGHHGMTNVGGGLYECNLCSATCGRSEVVLQ